MAQAGWEGHRFRLILWCRNWRSLPRNRRKWCAFGKQDVAHTTILRQERQSKETIMHDRRVLLATVSLLSLSVPGVLMAPPAAEARVTKIQITSKQSPTF